MRSGTTVRGCALLLARNALEDDRRHAFPVSPKLGGEATVMFGGSPVLGRAQGWRCAPPPSPALALIPSAHRPFWHPSGRRDAPPGGLAKAGSCVGSRGRAPGLIAREHGVEDDAPCSAPTSAPPSGCGRRLCALRHRGRQLASLVAYSHSPPCSCARARSHAHATVRVEEDARPVPRFSAGSASGGHGLKCGDGRLLEQPPVRRLCHTHRTRGGARGPTCVNAPVFVSARARLRSNRAGTSAAPPFGKWRRR
jgi:hypothetical protein